MIYNVCINFVAVFFVIVTISTPGIAWEMKHSVGDCFVERKINQ